MRKLLIISPFFPPINSADMHRVRQSLPYYRRYGYEPVVVAIDDKVESGYSRDENLLKSIPDDVEIHKIKPLPIEKTKFVGVGSIAIRSLHAYHQFITNYIKSNHVDLIFFSTTAFHLMYLGPIFKKKFGVPFVLDFQDPWRNDYFINLADNKKNLKYNAAHKIDSFLERKTVPYAEGIIAVSEAYCKMLKERYVGLKAKCEVLTFGANTIDFEILESLPKENVERNDLLRPDKINFVYIGRGGHDLNYAAKALFGAIAKGLEQTPDIFKDIHFTFIGTSYAAAGEGVKTIAPVATEFGVGDYVTEITDRIPYFQTLSILKNAHALAILGSEDTSYTASKIYPYVLAKKPLLAIFNENSSVISFLEKTQSGHCVSFANGDDINKTIAKVFSEIKEIIESKFEPPRTNWEAFEEYTAAAQTKKQTDFFDTILQARSGNSKKSLKKVLIVSPHFPPINAPDMQRVRMSLPYFKEFGWEPVVLASHEDSVIGYRDALLTETIPEEIEVHKVKGWNRRVTNFFGLRSLSMRSYIAMKRKGNKLLSTNTFDLVYFSTTMFHVCELGRYWKKKHKVPFVIDLQDPWRNDFFLQKQQAFPSVKHRISYLIDKYLEARTMPYVDGIISVSRGYLTALNERYGRTKLIPTKFLGFGYSGIDFALVEKKNIAPALSFDNDKINVVYIGAITKYFVPLLESFFKAFKESIKSINNYKFYFLGTNYSTSNHKTWVASVAEQLGISELVVEMPDRIPYFSALATMKKADILFLPGSVDVDYNASKVYNYMLSGRPIFSVFHAKSEVKRMINQADAGVVVGITEHDKTDELVEKIKSEMPKFERLHIDYKGLNEEAIRNHCARENTLAQVELFEDVIRQRS